MAFALRGTPNTVGLFLEIENAVARILPPLCKGRWIAERDGRVVEYRSAGFTTPQSRQASTVPLAQESQASVPTKEGITAAGSV